MDSIKDLLSKKADSIDLETKKNELTLIQEVLDRYFKGYARALKVRQDRLTIKVSSAPMASEVRFKQVIIIEELTRLEVTPIERLIITQTG